MRCAGEREQLGQGAETLGQPASEPAWAATPATILVTHKDPSDCHCCCGPDILILGVWWGVWEEGSEFKPPRETDF